MSKNNLNIFYIKRMAKPRAPISTRLRKRDKSRNKATVESDDKSVRFSPRADPDIYLDELESPISFVRGSTTDREQSMKEENDLSDISFGKNHLKRRLLVSTFYNSNVGAPVPSKRTRHSYPEQVQKRNDAATLHTITKSNNNSSKNNAQGSQSHSHSSKSKVKQTLNYHPQPTPHTHLSKSKTKPSSSPSKPPVTTATSKSKSKVKSTVITDPLEFNPVPVPLSGTIPAHVELSAKDKEKEYWRRQRRVFVQTRFITNDEGVLIANSVYSNMNISPMNRMVTSFQGNIANFRTKLRRIFVIIGKDLELTEEFVKARSTETLYEYIKNKTNIDTIKYVWGHWIADPFVDTETFYANTESVEILQDITIHLLILHFQEQYSVLSPKQARVKTRAFDQITRKLELPDNTEFP
ncbi:hypothetical protein K501DRAFT_276685 [Backusella circina FSU 941]|nr:hypothetical protein K501DRAFT_276685 [Backusella circina FSU 941]